MKWKIALSVLTLVLVFGGLAGTKTLQIMTMIQAGEAMGPMPVAVQVKSVEMDSWEQTLRAVGSVDAINGATIRSEAEGVVREILFSPGGKVEEGEVLVRLNSEVEEAQLEIAFAQLKLAKAELRRTRELHARQSVSDAELDAAVATKETAEATVENLKAVIDKRSIRAPFSGRVGVRQISLGNYIGRGDPVVVLQSLDVVYVNFSLPQSDLGAIAEGMEIRASTDAWEGILFSGELTAIQPSVNAVNRAIELQATFDNESLQLRPGMFVSVEVVLPEAKEVVRIPRSAILNRTYGDTVFVVQPAGEEGLASVRQQIVRTGEARGDFIEVTKGLEGDEEVVTAGVFKLRDGAFITSSDVGTVEPQLDPVPSES